MTGAGEEEGAPATDVARRSRSINWSALATPNPNNPLSKVNLGRSVESELLRSPAHPLAGAPPFLGTGNEAIYYTGDAEPYRLPGALLTRVRAAGPPARHWRSATAPRDVIRCRTATTTTTVAATRAAAPHGLLRVRANAASPSCSTTARTEQAKVSRARG